MILKSLQAFDASSRCCGATEVVRPVISRNCFMMFCSLPLNGLPAVLPRLGETGVSSEDSNCFCFTLRGHGPSVRTYLDIQRYLSGYLRAVSAMAAMCHISFLIYFLLTHFKLLRTEQIPESISSFCTGSAQPQYISRVVIPAHCSPISFGQ